MQTFLNNRFIILLYLVVAGMFLSLSASSGFCFHYAFTNYTNADGLPQSQVQAVIQDTRGYIWVGTYSGLGRYDGRQFRTLDTHDGLPGNFIFDIEPGPDGRIYVATLNGICMITHDLRVHPILLPEGDYVIRDIVYLAENELLLGVSDGYFHWDGHSLTRLIESSPAGTTRRPFRHDRKVYLPVANGLFVYHVDQPKTNVLEFDDLNIITGAVVDEILYIGTDNGIFCIEQGRPVLIVECDRVQIMIVHNSSMWVGTSGGLYHFIGKRWHRIRREHGLPDERIMSLASDREGIIWIGTNAGLTKLPYSYFKCYDSNDGLPSEFIWCIYEDPVLGLLFGGKDGISRHVGKSFQPVSFPGIDLRNNVVRTLLRSRDGSLWVGTQRNGLIRFGLDRAYRYDVILHVPVRSVYSLTEDAKSRTWIATSNGVFRYDSNSDEFFHYGIHEGVPNNLVWQVSRSPQDIIYIATNDGIAMFDGERFVVPEFARDLHLETVRNITFNENGEIWIGTNGNGLFMWDGRQTRRLDRTTGFIDNFIWGVTFEQSGAAWLGTNRGLVRLADGKTISYDRFDGLPGDELNLNACIRDSGGHLWFSLMPGVIEINNRLFTENTLPPLTNISRIETNSRVLVTPGEIIIEPHETEIVFYMDGLSFQDENEVRFKYRLKGYDDWSAPSQNGSVRYMNVPKGRYVFQVISCNNFGVWTEQPCSLNVQVKPAWHQMTWVRISAILLTVLLILSYIRLRLAASKRAQHKLERLVEERTRELYEASIRDPLLGVYNRSHIEKMVNKEIVSSRRHNDLICLALLDLDDFKRINDDYGHLMGDTVLKEVMNLLHDRIRAADLLGRFGGDEFIIVFFRTKHNGITHRIQSIIEAIEAMSISIPNGEIRITASIGAVCHTFSEESTVSYVSMISNADKALYQAKEAGKNRFVFSEMC